ncbi:SIS domain-containing protein [Pelagimonas varians]|uniref:Glutamine--fructose-6-phosphate aminotransferase [isomerizing] n=1 Tax=Pelagimonas varians TaxID=696760 RepID=A0A238KLJ5_9RHOB|nr:SIS domain-containing protein [Pelagimonas varians]PYG29498.1 glutamine--fructose-6-phosphate transaminase [Pelagimonas varians]SMX42942.1 Glutamine--fructose-6-phosphate aminotransferase [isomerizing] [Pelagimonas varians]
MTTETTQMRREIEEIPAAVDRLLTAGGPAIAKTKALIGDDIPYLMSVARGSSDHACSFLKYACELELGLPMASVGPSVASIYGAKLKVPKNALCLSVSQSGKSPDIVELTRALTEAGATSVAITNDDTSPLAQIATATLPICAGPELSVAATKTFVTSMVAGLWLIAELKGNTELLTAIRALPEHLEAATKCDWTMAANAINGQSVLTLGRGPSFAISNEAALKFKETCQIHAESYSSAEVMHGPVSIVERGFPVIAFAAADAAEQSLVDVADALTEKGALAFVTSRKAKKAICLPHQRTDHWLTDPISSVVSFYAMVEKVSTARNVNPDAPRHLNKVTETV